MINIDQKLKVCAKISDYTELETMKYCVELHIENQPMIASAVGSRISIDDDSKKFGWYTVTLFNMAMGFTKFYVDEVEDSRADAVKKNYSITVGDTL